MNKLAAIAVLALAALTASASPFYPATGTTDQEETARLAAKDMQIFSDFCLSSRDYIQAAAGSEDVSIDEEWLVADKFTVSRDKIEAACKSIEDKFQHIMKQFKVFQKTKLGNDAAKYSDLWMEHVPCVTSSRVVQARDACATLYHRLALRETFGDV